MIAAPASVNQLAWRGSQTTWVAVPLRSNEKKPRAVASSKARLGGN